MPGRVCGNRAKYVFDKCRCDLCTAANREYVRVAAQRIEPAYVRADEARAHIKELADVGVGLKQIAKASGISTGSLSKLVYSSRDRGPSARIRKTTADKIMAITPADQAAGARRPAGPTWQMLDEMIAAGVPKTVIAQAVGQTGPGLQLSRDTVTARNARAVAALHAAWKSGGVDLVRRDRWGNVTHIKATPAPTRRPADISDLVTALAEIVELRNEQPWRANAACRSRPQYLWFPGAHDREVVAAGIAICRACLVRGECRAAMFDERVGTYGGLTAGRRRSLRATA